MNHYKALIIYASITGNTEQIAQAFADTFSEYNITPRLVKLEGNYLGEQIMDVNVGEYDFVCIGTPVIASLPYHDLYIHYGAQDDYGRRSFGGAQGPGNGPQDDRHVEPGAPGGPGDPPGGDPNAVQHRIAFCTYGGVGEGPTEATASLELIKELFHGNGFVGFFACPGKVLYYEASRQIAQRLKINQFRAQELIVRFREDPEGPYFRDYDGEVLNMFRRAAEEMASDSFAVPAMADNDPLEIGKPGSRFWSYDLQNRPNERDIYMAKAFLSDIIEDYCLSDTGQLRKPSSVYWSIN